MTPPPPGLWSKFPKVAADVAAAEEIVARCEGLPDPLWAAWMWKVTDIPTVSCNVTADGTGWCLACGNLNGPPLYDAPSVIAHQRGPWIAYMGETAMIGCIGSLEDPMQRKRAWNALKGFDRVREDADPGPFPEGFLRSQPARVRQQLPPPLLRLVEGDAVATPSEEARRAELRQQADELMQKEAAGRQAKQPTASSRRR